MTEPSLVFSDAEQALFDSLKALLADRGSVDKTLARTESGQTYDDGLWHAVAAELGCARLLIPEGDGGARAPHPGGAAAAPPAARVLSPLPLPRAPGAPPAPP